MKGKMSSRVPEFFLKKWSILGLSWWGKFLLLKPLF